MSEDLKIDSFKLDNGIKVFTSNLQNSQFISINIFVGAGYRDELKNESGVAHFLEHSMFSGTKRRKDNSVISYYIESMGGYINAITSMEYTIYYIKVPFENFISALDIISDMFINSTFSEKFINIEKGVILQELQHYKDTRYLDEKFSSFIYQDTALEGDIDNDINNLENINRNLLKSFISRCYSNDKISISVVGNISKYNVNTEIGRYFGGINNNSNYKREEFKLKNDKGGIFLLNKNNVQESNIILSMKSLPFNNDYFYPLMVMNYIIGVGEYSYINRLLRFELGLVYSAYSYLIRYSDNGFFSIKANIDEKNIEKALMTLLRFLNDFKKGKFYEDDINRAKGFLLGGLLSNLETSEDIADKIVIENYYFGEPLKIINIKKSINKVNKDDILEIFNLIYKDLYLGILTPSRKNKEVYANIISDAN